MALVGSIRAYFLAENFPEYRRWDVGMARVFTWSAIGGFTTQALASFAIVQHYFLGIFALATIFFMLVAIKLSDRGQTKLARVLRMTVALSFFVVTANESGGIRSPAFFWAGVFVLGAMFSFGTISAIPVYSALALMATYFYWQNHDTLYFFQYVVSLSFTFVLSYLFERLSKHFISYAEQQKATAEESRQNTESILKSVNEGILSILPKGIIGSIESPYFEKIIGHNAYMERSFKEVFLDRLLLNSDKLDQCWQAIQADIGEDSIGFYANEACYLTEAKLRNGESILDLKLKWSPLLVKDRVSKITLVVEDITEYQKKDYELSLKAQELAIIGQLVEVSESKCREFFATARELFRENELMLQEAGLSPSRARPLFINLHTVKGAARTLGFSDLSSAIHDAEKFFRSVIDQKAEVSQDQLKQQIQSVRSVFELYDRLNFNKLKRSELTENQNVSIERTFMEQQFLLLSAAIHAMDHKNPVHADMTDMLKKHRHELARHIFELLPSVMSGYADLARLVAASLGKPVPEFVVNLPEIVVTPDLKQVLDNCMIHIIRNALDHGIEIPELRIRKGKPAAGKIEVKGQQWNGRLELRISDDGRGLPLYKLRAKAEELHMNRDLPTQNIANLIFESGLSTAEQVTEVSGRGLGMVAVRDYIEKLGGSVAIELFGALEDGYQKFALRISLPLPEPAQEYSRSLKTGS